MFEMLHPIKYLGNAENALYRTPKYELITNLYLTYASNKTPSCRESTYENYIPVPLIILSFYIISRNCMEYLEKVCKILAKTDISYLAKTIRHLFHVFPTYSIEC